MMRIDVRLFAAARQLAGTDVLSIDCDEDVTVADLRQAIETQCPALTSLLASARFAVDQEYVPESTRLSEHQEVACIPPVSGG